MREIPAKLITEAVSEMCVTATCLIAEDIRTALIAAEKVEPAGSLGRGVLDTLLANAEVAENKMIPTCQDTGLVVAFVEIGQEVHITGGYIEEAINAGVADGYEKGYLRKSVVADPLRRENTKNNTPAVIHYRLTPGDKLKITISPKGFGSENMSALAMLKPSQGLPGIKDFVLQTVKKAGPNPCPPIILGIGVGGSMEKAAVMAKESLLRPVGTKNADPFWNGIEEDLLAAVNDLGIGPAGFGGRTTALAVHITPYATHIAGLPVAVNVGCHATRHAERIL
ncbi:fumarate hydratase [Deltaproteobacteria bacterium OttesenSCG-928-M10]|nr:fumarate hydratase [Deltaproteobacteria bacterium OttesenSCG-928-M10]